MNERFINVQVGVPEDEWPEFVQTIGNRREVDWTPACPLLFARSAAAVAAVLGPTPEQDEEDCLRLVAQWLLDNRRAGETLLDTADGQPPIRFFVDLKARRVHFERTKANEL